MTGPTKPVRIPERVGDEVLVAAQVLGVSSGDLIERAWISFKESPAFKEDFLAYQRALAAGDLDTVVETLNRRASRRAADRATRANA